MYAGGAIVGAGVYRVGAWVFVWVTGGRVCVDVDGVVVGALTAYRLFGVVDPSPRQQ